jgi:protein-export membrane protein SecD/preprotein translocase SecF subunit
MLRRLAVICAILAGACLLLFLQNKVYVGHQDFQIELRDQSATPPAARAFEVVLKDAAGSPRTIATNAEWDIVKSEIETRLGQRVGEEALLAGTPIRAAGGTVTVSLKEGADPAAARSRLSTRAISFPNPPKELFHLEKGIDIRGGVEFICRLRNREGVVVPATDDVLATLRGRLDERGLTEPTVSRLSNGDVQVVIPGGTKADAARTRSVLETTGQLEFREVLWPYNNDPSKGQIIRVDPSDPNPAVRQASKGFGWVKNSPDLYLNRGEILAPNQADPGEPYTEFYRLGPVRLTGSDVADASGATHQGQLAVSINFTAIGSSRNGEFTNSLFTNDRERGGQGTGTLAILFDGVIKSVAHVESPSSNSCIIHGRFTQDDVDRLRSALKGGSLSVTPEVLSERVVGASLGEDAWSRTIDIRVAAFLAIIGFMWIYYRRMGTVANICLVVTAVLIFAILSIFNATITLPGFAGLVLIIGMAVDTNILIFERIREELKEDKGLKAAIEAGYDRAFLTVIDSHLTTLATSLILYWIGTGPVKGFGLTLAIGIVVNLFSGVYVGRLLTDWLCRGKTTLTMASWVPAMRLPYVRMRWISYIFSIVTAVVGLAWFAWGQNIRGGTFEGNFDIDFTGGNMVQVILKEERTMDQIAQAVAAAHAKLPAETQKTSLINPHELRYQPYFSEFGNANASRQWVFRVRDDEGSAIEAKRRVFEEQSAAIYREIISLRDAGAGKDKIDAKLAEQKPIDDQVRDLGKLISKRTEVFKAELSKTFPGLIAADGDEVISATWSANTLAFQVAVLDAPEQARIEEVGRRLARLGEIEVKAEGKVLNVTARYKEKPAPRSDVGDDPMAARFASLLAASAGADAPALARVGAELYNRVSDVTASQSITVAKPFPASEHFSGQVADRMKWQALLALVLSLLAILAYVAARFEFRFGIGAVVALGHDLLMTLGIIALLQIRIDLTVVAALLTIIGTSINETIIIYDRIRENLRRTGKPMAEVIDLSVSQTMARTMLTTGTTVATLIVLLIFGGEALRPFTATLLVGICLGTYSSIFVAAPLLLSFKGRVVIPKVEKAEDTDPAQGILAKPEPPKSPF